MIKRAVAGLLAVVLVVGLGACAKQESYEGKRVVYDEPAGYELVIEQGNSKLWTRENASGETTHGVIVNVSESNESFEKGIKSKKVETLEDELSIEFDTNLKVEFVEMNKFPGIRIDEVDENGTVIEITYHLLVGKWWVIVISQGDEANVNQVHTDMQSVINSMRIEEITFIN